MKKEQLKLLAADIVEGRVFTDRDVPDVGLLKVVFMPLMFMNEEQKEAFVKNPPALIYEYISQAGPIVINGCPIFTSMRQINLSEFKIVRRYFTMYLYNRIRYQHGTLRATMWIIARLWGLLIDKAKSTLNRKGKYGKKSN